MWFRLLDDRSFSPEQLEALRRHGYDIDENGRVKLVNLAHPWVSAGRLGREESFVSIHTWYDDGDFEAARYVRVWGYPGYGSPLPAEFDFTYKNYDQKTYCRKCGANPNQLKPFEIRRAPRRLNNMAFELVNTHELFVTDDLYEDIFHPIGVERMDVLLNKDKTPIKGISQLVIKKRIDVEVGEDDVLDICDACQSVRYHPQPLFGFHKPLGDDFDIAATNQCFGAGRMTSPAIIISQAVYRLIRSRKAKGFVFRPCRDVWRPDMRIDVKQADF